MVIDHLINQFLMFGDQFKIYMKQLIISSPILKNSNE